LDAALLTSEFGFCLYSRWVKVLLKRFRDDPRCWRMMLVALTDRVNADGMNAGAVAKHCLASCPGAAVIIVTGAGCTMVGTMAGGAQAVPGVLNHRSVARDDNGKPAQLGALIDKVPMGTPLFVVGYTCVGRSVSLRGSRRVITHMIAGLGRSKTTGEVSQLLARPLGDTKGARAANGFAHVEVLTMAEDLAQIKALYALTHAAIRDAGNGELAKLQDWAAEPKDSAHDAVTKSLRRHGPRAMCVGETLGFAAPAPAPAPAVKWPRVLLAVYDLARGAAGSAGSAGSAGVACGHIAARVSNCNLSACLQRCCDLGYLVVLTSSVYLLTSEGVEEARSLRHAVRLAAPQAATVAPAAAQLVAPAAAQLVAPASAQLVTVVPAAATVVGSPAAPITPGAAAAATATAWAAGPSQRRRRTFSLNEQRSPNE